MVVVKQVLSSLLVTLHVYSPAILLSNIAVKVPCTAVSILCPIGFSHSMSAVPAMLSLVQDILNDSPSLTLISDILITGGTRTVVCKSNKKISLIAIVSYNPFLTKKGLST